MTHSRVIAPSGIIYPVWQTGSGTPLLLLHGFTGSHETWQPLVECLSQDQFVVTLDLPGHGDTELPNASTWTFSHVIADLAWIIEARLGGRGDVLGYSMGGRLALALALAHPDRVRRLILESASPGIADDAERAARQLADEQLAASILDRGVAEFVQQWETLPMWKSQANLSDHDRERQRRIRLGHTAAGLAANLRATGTGVQPSFWEQLPQLQRPTLLVAGELDQKFATIASAMYQKVPTLQLEIVNDTGHAVHLERPADYLRLIKQFLDQTDISSTQMEEQT